VAQRLELHGQAKDPLVEQAPGILELEMLDDDDIVERAVECVAKRQPRRSN